MNKFYDALVRQDAIDELLAAGKVVLTGGDGAPGDVMSRIDGLFVRSNFVNEGYYWKRIADSVPCESCSFHTRKGMRLCTDCSETDDD